MRKPNEYMPESTGAPTGHYQSRLTPDEAKVVAAYVAWLKSDEHSTKPFGDAVANSYRTYIAQCFVLLEHEGKTWKDLSSSQRSAWRKFGEFAETDEFNEDFPGFFEDGDDDEDNTMADEIDAIGDELDES